MLFKGLQDKKIYTENITAFMAHAFAAYGQEYDFEREKQGLLDEYNALYQSYHTAKRIDIRYTMLTGYMRRARKLRQKPPVRDRWYDVPSMQHAMVFDAKHTTNDRWFRRHKMHSILGTRKRQFPSHSPPLPPLIKDEWCAVASKDFCIAPDG